MRKHFLDGMNLVSKACFDRIDRRRFPNVKYSRKFVEFAFSAFYQIKAVKQLLKFLDTDKPKCLYATTPKFQLPLMRLEQGSNEGGNIH